MKLRMRLTMVAVLPLLLAGPTFAGSTPQDEYKKAVAQFGGVEVGANPRAMCICANGSDDGLVGYMIIGTGTGQSHSLTCHVPGFLQNGEIAGGIVCTQFVPLVR